MKLQAWRELYLHYKIVFKHFWAARHELDAKEFKQHESEFLPAVLAVQSEPTSPSGRWVARILMALVLCVLFWSIFGHIDIIVHAQGAIIPSGHTKTISSVEVAKIKSIYVQEGQKVKAGDVLIELDTSMIAHDQSHAQGDSQIAQLKAARATAMLNALKSGITPHMAKLSDIPQDMWRAEQAHLDGQWQDLQTKKQRLIVSIAQYREMLPLAQKQAHDYGVLAQTHDVSTHDWQDKQKTAMQLQAQMFDAKSQLTTLVSGVQKDALDDLTDANKVQAASTQEALKAQAHSDLLTIVTPVDGTVQQLQVNTVGASVPAAQALMQIVPDEEHIEIEAKLENKDIGFIQEGQTAEIKIDTFDYTKYGTLMGTILHVSRDAVSEQKKDDNLNGKDKSQGLQYSVLMGLNQKTIIVDGKEIPLTAGMSVQAEIKTGQRRVIEYVLSPLVKHVKESLHER